MSKGLNSLHKRILRENAKALLKGLQMSTTFITTLYQEYVISEEQMEQIQAKATNADKVYELLSQLPKRGPKAFNSFLSALGTDHPWLADKLREDCNEISDSLSPSPTQEAKDDQRRNLPSEASFSEAGVETLRDLVALKVKSVLGEKHSLSSSRVNALTEWVANQIHDRAADMTSTRETSSAKIDSFLNSCRQCREKDRRTQQKLALLLQETTEHHSVRSLLDQHGFSCSERLSNTNWDDVSVLLTKLLAIIEEKKEEIDECLDYFDRREVAETKTLPELVKKMAQDRRRLGEETRKQQSEVQKLECTLKSCLRREDYQGLQEKNEDLLAINSQLNSKLDSLQSEITALTAMNETLAETSRLALQRQRTIDDLKEKVASLERDSMKHKRSFLISIGPEATRPSEIQARPAPRRQAPLHTDTDETRKKCETYSSPYRFRKKRSPKRNKNEE